MHAYSLQKALTSTHPLHSSAIWQASCICVAPTEVLMHKKAVEQAKIPDKH